MPGRPSAPRCAAVAVLLALMTACTSADRPKPAAASASPAPSAPETTLTLFHATHFDGQFAQPGGVTFTHYAGQLKQVRAQLPQGQPSLFLGNGDDVSGEYAIEAFHAAGLDANTYGFDELHFGLDRLAALLPQARYAGSGPRRTRIRH